jgi:hypothetical protein
MLNVQYVPQNEVRDRSATIVSSWEFYNLKNFKESAQANSVRRSSDAIESIRTYTKAFAEWAQQETGVSLLETIVLSEFICCNWVPGWKEDFYNYIVPVSLLESGIFFPVAHDREQVEYLCANSHYVKKDVDLFGRLGVFRQLEVLVMAELTGAAPWLSPSRHRLLHQLVAEPTSSDLNPHDRLQQAAIRAVGASEHLLLPPILELIVEVAMIQQKSFDDAALWLRGTDEAKAYRKKLNELRVELNSPSLSDQARAVAYISKLADAGKIWAESPLTKVSAIPRRTKVRALVSAVPFVGRPLSALLPESAIRAIAEMGVKGDPLHVFVSRWFRETGNKTVGLKDASQSRPFDEA